MKHRSRRVALHPILGAAPAREEVEFSYNDQILTACAGEVLAAALMAHGIRDFGAAGLGRAPSGIYCAIGHCFACQVTIDGTPGVRACLTPVRAGMRVTTGRPDDEGAAW
jgi:sarcosine oxidase subunit alpha